MARPRKELPFPEGLERWTPVKITSNELHGIKTGLVSDMCRKDGGIIVQVTSESSSDVTKYFCIQTSNGDTIESLR